MNLNLNGLFERKANVREPGQGYQELAHVAQTVAAMAIEACEDPDPNIHAVTKGINGARHCLDEAKRCLNQVTSNLVNTHLGAFGSQQKYSNMCSESEVLHYEMGVKESIINRMELVNKRLKRLRWWTMVLQVVCLWSICWDMIWSLWGVKDMPLTATAAALGMFFLLATGYRWCWKDWNSDIKQFREELAAVEAKRGPYR